MERGGRRGSTIAERGGGQGEDNRGERREKGRTIVERGGRRGKAIAERGGGQGEDKEGGGGKGDYFLSMWLHSI